MERITKIEDLENIRSLEDGEYYSLKWIADDKPVLRTKDIEVTKHWMKAIKIDMCYVTIERIVKK